jgi:bifunctional DNA-binding transcriptional regulator/antitoxin component of YhaV-PrlF toxin-antitoxin module
MTLPADIRAKLRIKPGQRVAIHLNDRGEAVIEPVSSLQDLRQKAYASLSARGVTDEQVREMALGHTSGDGFTAAIKEKYGKR